MMDVVYILKNDFGDSSELRYSLRSVVENFPHSRVVFAGGCPEGFQPDYQIDYRQMGATKWDKVNNTILKVCEDEEVTDDFWLFNDDFFIMQPWAYGDQPLIGGKLADHIARIEAERDGEPSSYSAALRKVEKLLWDRKLPTNDYCIHVPMLVNKAKAQESIAEFGSCPMFRSLYGNYTYDTALQIADVKISDPWEEPDPDALLLSSLEGSFALGRVGAFVRERFQEPSEYEGWY